DDAVIDRTTAGAGISSEGILEANRILVANAGGSGIAIGAGTATLTSVLVDSPVGVGIEVSAPASAHIHRAIVQASGEESFLVHVEGGVVASASDVVAWGSKGKGLFVTDVGTL